MVNIKLIKKFIGFSFGSWVALLLGFVTTPITTRLFTPVDFGRFSMYTVTVYLLAAVCVFGYLNAYVRYFHEVDHSIDLEHKISQLEQNQDHHSMLLFDCIKLPLLLWLILSIVCLFAWRWVSHYIYGVVSFSLVAVFIASVLLQIINTFSDYTVRLFERARLFSYLQILNKIVMIILMMTMFYLLKIINFSNLVYANCLTSGVIVLIGVSSVAKIWSFNPRFINLIKIKDFSLISYAFPFFLTSIISWFNSSVDRVILKHWWGFADVGIYSAAFRIVVLVNVAKTAIDSFLGPEAFKRYHHNQELVKDFLIKANEAFSVILFGLLIVSFMFRDFFVLFFGHQYQAVVYIMPFILYEPMLSSLSETTVLGINFKKRASYHIYIALAVCLTNFSLNLILVPYLATKGAVLATATSALVYFYLRTWLSAKVYYVAYQLNKINLMILLISIVFFIFTFYTNFLWSIMVGCLLLIVLYFLYQTSINNYIRLIKINDIVK